MSNRALNWEKLLSAERFNSKADSRKKPFVEQYASEDFRVPHEKDFDRVVFSTPVRRLQDKTQVFPLDQHDSVRTRLTHSIEVSNLGRTIASQLVSSAGLESSVPHAMRVVPALVAAISMAHDIGNPPFGHQGEAAIQRWVAQVKPSISSRNDFRSDLFNDYLYFDGNPQGFRLLTQLQGVESGGLNLTASTLRAFFKYPWSSSSSRLDPKKPKFGYFQSEKLVFDWCTKEVGLGAEDRHPLAALMEASDDIAYSVLDVEDGIKKDIVSTAHLVKYLSVNKEGEAKEWVGKVLEQYDSDLGWLSALGVKGREQEDVLTQLLRSYLIALLVSAAAPALKDAISLEKACDGNPCLSEPRVSALLALLKDYAKANIYTNRSVQRIELDGHRVIPKLLQWFWDSLAKKQDGVASKRDDYIVGMISPNYLRIYKDGCANKSFPEWYLRLQLVCDMVCGMTDSYALRVHEELRKLDD